MWVIVNLSLTSSSSAVTLAVTPDDLGLLYCLTAGIEGLFEVLGSWFCVLDSRSRSTSSGLNRCDFVGVQSVQVCLLSADALIKSLALSLRLWLMSFMAFIRNAHLRCKSFNSFIAEAVKSLSGLYKAWSNVLRHTESNHEDSSQFASSWLHRSHLHLIILQLVSSKVYTTSDSSQRGK